VGILWFCCAFRVDWVWRFGFDFLLCFVCLQCLVLVLRSRADPTFDLSWSLR
jgi:hypothetical protein